ncbi:hypothetical protein [Ktedonobacter sp. SOSP1-85]|uniref:hypothetical protein n=1 Tax=Ktedonobacter sp. SOSP1-85 TaxID=2778367 RepID=UPI001916386B|nr:hypothetical protein [Ktedonobacter sp. SOSP1-85]
MPTYRIRLHEYRPVARVFVQLLTGKWEKALEASVEELAALLRTLQDQMAPIQERIAKAKLTYGQAERQHADLQPTIDSWTKKRDTQPAHYIQKQAALTQDLADLERELQAGNPRIAALEQALIKARQERALIEDALAHLDQQVEDAKREAGRLVLESAQVVGATLTSLYLNPTLLNQQC